MEDERLNVVIPFYGAPPPLEQVPRITAAVLGVYTDDRADPANIGRDDLDASLRKAGIDYRISVYPGTHYGFYNDTSPEYDDEQAIAAWNETLAWLDEHLRIDSPFS